VIGVAAVFVVLLGGIVASAGQAARATRERDRATAAEQRATRERDRAISAEGVANAAEAQALKERNGAIAAKERADAEAAAAKALNGFFLNVMRQRMLGEKHPDTVDSMDCSDCHAPQAFPRR
jgi:hypothetical protein